MLGLLEVLIQRNRRALRGPSAPCRVELGVLAFRLGSFVRGTVHIKGTCVHIPWELREEAGVLPYPRCPFVSGGVLDKKKQPWGWGRWGRIAQDPSRGDGAGLLLEAWWWWGLAGSYGAGAPDVLLPRDSFVCSPGFESKDSGGEGDQE